MMTALPLQYIAQSPDNAGITQATTTSTRSEAIDRIQVMKRLQEMPVYRSRNYRRAAPSSSQCCSSNSISKYEGIRMKMCEWCYQVVDHCRLSRESVAIAMSYVDRYITTQQGQDYVCGVLNSNNNNNSKRYQLVIVTSLYMAVKLHETAVSISMKALVHLSHGMFSEQDIRDMELSILTALQWRLHGPTAVDFARHFMSLLVLGSSSSSSCTTKEEKHVVCRILSKAKYQLELAVAESSMIGILPSKMAMAAIANAISETNTSFISVQEKDRFLQDIQHCAGLTYNNRSMNILQSNLNLLIIGIGSSNGSCSNNIDNHHHSEQQQQSQQLRQRTAVTHHNPTPITATTKAHHHHHHHHCHHRANMHSQTSIAL